MYKKRLNSFLKNKVAGPFLEMLRQGITPQKLAVTLALGVVIGVIPAFGVTTIICTFVGLRLRLNLPVFLLVSYLVQPLQLILFVPFLKAGSFMLHFQSFQLSPDQVLLLFKTDWLGALKMLWQVNAAAVMVWLFTALPLFGTLYLLFLPLVRRFIPAPVLVPAKE